jgi:hypothetical protein
VEGARLVENWRARLGVQTRGPRQRAREIVRFDAARIGLPAKEKVA